MAFTATQKANVRYYLGYPDQFRDVGSTLESGLAGGLSAEGETIVIALLASLAAIDSNLTSALARLKALKVGSIELPGFGEIQALRSEGRRLAARLATIFGVEVQSDVFAEGGSASSGGFIPLG